MYNFNKNWALGTLLLLSSLVVVELCEYNVHYVRIFDYRLKWCTLCTDLSLQIVAIETKGSRAECDLLSIRYGKIYRIEETNRTQKQ